MRRGIRKHSAEFSKITQQLIFYDIISIMMIQKILLCISCNIYYLPQQLELILLNLALQFSLKTLGLILYHIEKFIYQEAFISEFNTSYFTTK